MHKFKNRRLWQALLALMLLAAGGASFHAAHAEGSLVATLSVGTAATRGAATRGAITTGDVIPLTLSVTHPAGWRVIFPTLEKQWGDFEVRGQGVPEIVTNPNGTQTTTQEIKVARMRPGEVQTPALSLQVANDQGSLSSVEVAPVPIAVRSVLIEGDTNLREIKAQADLVSERRPYWPLATAGLIGAEVLGIYGIQRRRQRKQIDRRTPRQRALDMLAGLSAIKPQTATVIKAQSTHLADCLRDYLAASTPLPARDLTTRELARHLKEQEVPAAWSAQVVEVLQVCDDVKFANEDLEGAHLQAMIATVRQLVEQYPPQAQPAHRRTGRKKQAEVMV